MTIRQGHSSVRTAGRPPIPENAYSEFFQTMVNNEVSKPKVNRNSVSCRKPHRESSRGHFVYDITPKGKPIKREGFMMGCKRDSDCQVCGSHPISGKPYVCTPNPQFYTFFVLNESSPEGFFTNEPGDDQFDIVNSKGVCTDVSALCLPQPIPTNTSYTHMRIAFAGTIRLCPYPMPKPCRQRSDIVRYWLYFPFVCF